MTSTFIESDTELDPKRLTGTKVLFIFLAFFGLMFAVNGVFLYHAITSFPGEDIKKSYVQGLNYNQTLAQRSAQAGLGWNVAIGFEESGLVLELKDEAGVPLRGYTVRASLRRPTNDRADQTFELSEVGQQGRYIAPVSLDRPGRWDVAVNISEPGTDSVLMQSTKTLMMAP